MTKKQDNDDKTQICDDCEAKIQVLESENAELKDLAKRIKADFDNFRKRLESEQNLEIQQKLRKFLLELLNVLDSYELALSNFNQLVKNIETNKDEINNNYKGLALTYEMLKEFLKNNDVVEITHNKEFDPNLHEVLLQETSDKHKDKEIIDVLQKGYMYKDNVLRTAKVKIANNPGEKQ